MKRMQENIIWYHQSSIYKIHPLKMMHTCRFTTRMNGSFFPASDCNRKMEWIFSLTTGIIKNKIIAGKKPPTDNEKRGTRYPWALTWGMFHKQQSPTACPVKVIYLFQKKEPVTILFLFKKHHVWKYLMVVARMENESKLVYLCQL